MARREWEQQIKLAGLLVKWLPDDACWSATDPVAASSGMQFRPFVRADGTVQCWTRSKLALWKNPRQDPTEPRPQHSDVVARHR